MASILRDALTLQGNHNVSNITDRTSIAVANLLKNGAVYVGDKLENPTKTEIDNGLLVELLDTRDDEGNLQCQDWKGTKPFYIVQSSETGTNGLVSDMGENDYKNFFNRKGEMLNLYRANYPSMLYQETSAYIVDGGVTLKVDLPVEYDVDQRVFKVVATSAKPIAFVDGIDTEMGQYAQKDTIRIRYAQPTV